MSDPLSGVPGYATWGRRLCAYLLDTLVLIPAFAVLFALVAVADPDESAAFAIVLVLAYLATLVLPFAYFTFFHGNERGQTPGKRALGIRVISGKTGRSIGYGRALGRYATTAAFWFFVVPAVLDYLWPLWDRDNQPLHDKIVGSVVVRLYG